MADGLKPARLMDVAAAAGVSVATASRALHGGGRQVRPDLAERVVSAARRLHYAPNAQARAMVKGASTVVGLVVHDITDPYFSAIAGGVSQAAEEQGLIVMLSTTLRRPEYEVRALRALRTQQGRAAILVGSRMLPGDSSGELRAEIEAFQREGGRVAAVSQPVLGVDTVVVDNSASARALAVALIDLGYTRFAVLGGPAEVATADERRHGFVAGLAEAGLAEPTVLHDAFTRDGGYAAMNALIDAGQLPECVFAVNDVMAVGALAACRDRGLRLPDDLALAGFDDIATLRDVSPQLTTVRLPLSELGAMAMSLVASAGEQPRQHRVLGEVVIRESTPRRR